MNVPDGLKILRVLRFFLPGLKEVCVVTFSVKITFVQPLTTRYALAQALRFTQREQRHKDAAHRTASPAFLRPWLNVK